MKCKDAVQAMHACLDETPRAPLLGEIRDHLETCGQCSKAWERMERFESLACETARREEAAPPESLHRGIMQAVADQGTPPRARRTAVASAAWWSAAAALLFAGYLLADGLFESSREKNRLQTTIAQTQPAVPLEVPGIRPPAALPGGPEAYLSGAESVLRLLSSGAASAPDPQGMGNALISKMLESLPPGLLTAASSELPVRIPELAVPRDAWRDAETVVLASAGISGKLRRSWNHGSELLRTLSGGEALDAAAE